MALITNAITRGARNEIQILKITARNRTLDKINLEDVKLLRNVILPEFMLRHGIDTDKKGFRMVVEVEDSSLSIDLITGDGERGVPAQSPQDWMSSTLNPWERYQPGKKPSFFDLCAEAAAQRLPKMKFGAAMLYPFDDSAVFGVMDDNPKAPLHFLMMAREPYGNMADETFSYELWQAFFQGAAKLLAEKAQGHYARLVANFGVNFQMGPRVHMHVLASAERLHSVFPADHGFIEQPDGTISAPAGSVKHQEIIDLIQKRMLIAGFTDEARSERRALDQDLFDRLKEVRIQ